MMNKMIDSHNKGETNYISKTEFSKTVYTILMKVWLIIN